MVKFNKCNLTPNIMDQWVHGELNVLLIGEKGVGKSAQIIDTFKRNNLKYSYFSGATLDPWIHILGIPKTKKGDDGEEKMTFVLPENLDNDVEAIFCDEWNRTHKTVRNALLELQQFKSINGRKFPNLKMVWGAINPPISEEDDDISYDAEELDPAQMDRFHVIVELPNKPNLKYFKTKFGNYQGKILVDWWNEQPKEALKILSPRRLDYIGTSFNKGLDIKYLLPISANEKDLVKKLSIDETVELINQMFANPTDDVMKDFLQDDKNFLKYKNKLKSEKYWRYWRYAKPEHICEEINSNENFENYALYRLMGGDVVYKKVASEIFKATPKSNFIKILEILTKNNTKVDLSNDTKTNSVCEFPTVEKKNTNGKKDPLYDYELEYVWGDNCFKKINFIVSTVRIINTHDRKKMIDFLYKAIENGHAKDEEIINITVNCLKSFQKGTIKKIPYFLQVLGTTVVLAKKMSKKTQLEEFIEIIKENKHKISSNRIDEFIKYLGGDASHSFENISKEFLDTVTNIRSVLNISSNGSDILDLIKL